MSQKTFLIGIAVIALAIIVAAFIISGNRQTTQSQTTTTTTSVSQFATSCSREVSNQNLSYELVVTNFSYDKTNYQISFNFNIVFNNASSKYSQVKLGPAFPISPYSELPFAVVTFKPPYTNITFTFSKYQSATPSQTYSYDLSSLENLGEPDRTAVTNLRSFQMSGKCGDATDFLYDLFSATLL